MRSSPWPAASTVSTSSLHMTPKITGPVRLTDGLPDRTWTSSETPPAVVGVVAVDDSAAYRRRRHGCRMPGCRCCRDGLSPRTTTPSADTDATRLTSVRERVAGVGHGDQVPGPGLRAAEDQEAVAGLQGGAHAVAADLDPPDRPEGEQAGAADGRARGDRGEGPRHQGIRCPRPSDHQEKEPRHARALPPDRPRRPAQPPAASSTPTATSPAASTTLRRHESKRSR